ncbi:MAG TPA: 4Fe-4S binding protein [Ignavibacteriaceae bacterium]|nr:4Fe-4S binding protein [Ignavibacteriaceae bacterium]
MSAIKRRKVYNQLNLLRKAVQIFSLVFLIAVPIMVVNEIYSILGTLYSITIFGVDIVDPAMALQTTLLSRELVEVLIIGFIIPALLALIFGKIFCSWMCPFNTLSEYWQLVTKKILPKRFKKIKIKHVEKNPNPLIYWGILIFLFILTVILDFPLITFLSAPGIISAEISHYVMGMGIGLELFIVILIIFIEGITFKSYWCKYVCPVGGVLAIFRTPKTLSIIHNESACSCAANVEPCSIACPLGLSPKSEKLYPYCYNCGLCIKICEKTGFGALSFGFGQEKSIKEKVETISTNKD